MDDYHVKRNLSNIVSPNLEDITFLYVLRAYNSKGPYPKLWLELDGILARPQFSELTKVSITLTRSPPIDSYRQWFANHLPQCHARGILVVDVSRYDCPLLHIQHRTCGSVALWET